MNFEPSERRRFARMRPEDRALLLKGKAVVLTCLASLLLLSSRPPRLAPAACFWGLAIIAIALFLMLIFVVGSCGLKRNNYGLYGCYLLGVFFAILVLLVFIIFGYVAVGGIDLGHAANGREYNLKECRRGWLRGRVTHSSQHFWATTSACLRRSHVCNGMTDLVGQETQGGDADVRVMSPIESGCCKPPSSCGLTYVNGTTWISTPASAPATNINRDGVDCSRWSNDHQTLCFQCDSCKAGFLHNTSEAWTLECGGHLYHSRLRRPHFVLTFNLRRSNNWE